MSRGWRVAEQATSKTVSTAMKTCYEKGTYHDQEVLIFNHQEVSSHQLFELKVRGGREGSTVWLRNLRFERQIVDRDTQYLDTTS